MRIDLTLYWANCKRQNANKSSHLFRAFARNCHFISILCVGCNTITTTSNSAQFIASDRGRAEVSPLQLVNRIGSNHQQEQQPTDERDNERTMKIFVMGNGSIKRPEAPNRNIQSPGWPSSSTITIDRSTSEDWMHIGAVLLPIANRNRIFYRQLHSLDTLFLYQGLQVL